MDYPAYTMAICQHKQVIDVCSTIFDQKIIEKVGKKGKNNGSFVQLRLIRSSILPTLNQTQRQRDYNYKVIYYSMYLN